MCKKTNYKIPNPRIDKCMVNLIRQLRFGKVETLSCCCGHYKYNQSIVVRAKDGSTIDLISNRIIPRKRKFYKRDKQGYYYLKEAINESSFSKTNKRKSN